MTAMRPWLEREDAPPEVLELLRSAGRSRPLAESTRARSARRVAALSMLPAAAGALVWAPHAALGAALGAVVTAAVVVPQIVSAPVPAAMERTTAASPPRNGPGRAAPAAAAPPVAGAAEPPSESPAATPTASSFARLPSVREPVEHDLSREARTLEHARELLAQAPTDALSLLTRHEREFPDGALAVERELLAVDALLRLGRRSEAEARGRALRGRAPRNLYERRLEKMLGGTR